VTFEGVAAVEGSIVILWLSGARQKLEEP